MGFSMGAKWIDGSKEQPSPWALTTSGFSTATAGIAVRPRTPTSESEMVSVSCVCMKDMPIKNLGGIGSQTKGNLLFYTVQFVR